MTSSTSLDTHRAVFRLFDSLVPLEGLKLPDDMADVLGDPADGVLHLAVVHRRVRTFRVLGVFELLLKAIAFIILLPVWIVVFVSALAADAGDDGAGGESYGGGRSSGPKGGGAKSYGTSSLFSYHHEILVRRVGANGASLVERAFRVVDPVQADRVMASVLSYAARHGLVVREAIDVQPGAPGPSEEAEVWCGGRPLMQERTGSVREVEQALLDAGFRVERSEGEIVLRRSFAPMSLWAPIGLILVGTAAVVVVGIVGTPLSLLLYAPILVVALWVERREVGRFLFDLLCGLLRMHERYELSVTADCVSYRYRHAWRSSKGSIDTSSLIAVGFSGGLGDRPVVDRRAPALRIIGVENSVRAPSRLTLGGGRRVADWLASIVLSLRSGSKVEDARTKCPSCGSLYDFGARDVCPRCGDARGAQ